MDQGLRSRSAVPSDDEVEEEEDGKRRGRGRSHLSVRWRTVLGALPGSQYQPLLAAFGVVFLLTFLLVLSSKGGRQLSERSSSDTDSMHRSNTAHSFISTTTSISSSSSIGSNRGNGRGSIGTIHSANAISSIGNRLRGIQHRRGMASVAPCANDGERVKPFIFVYDPGAQYTEQVRKKKPAWYSEVYDAEKVFLEYVLSNDAVRTLDPERASLFYVPFYSAYFLACQFKDWENNMREAVMRTSEAWESLLKHIRSDHPYFNRTNGRDHFSVLSMDYGRCQALPYVDPAQYGDMFFLTMAGDKMLRSSHSHSTRNMQILTYNYGSQHVVSDVPDIPCFRYDLDVVLPPTLEDSLQHPMAITSPLAGERTITALFRFRVEHHHHQPVLHTNHFIRKELFERYRRKGLQGWDFGVSESEARMREDMQHSVFCICPPGHSQWSTRMAKAILAGCIPVTFFRDHENPWEEEIEYSLFSINIDPDALGTLYERVEGFLRNPRKLLALQRNLEKVQKLFSWNESEALGVQAHASQVLWCRARKMEKGSMGWMRRGARALEQGQKGRGGWVGQRKQSREDAWQ